MNKSLVPPYCSQWHFLNLLISQKTVIWENGINKRGPEYSVKEIKVASMDFLIFLTKVFCSNIFDKRNQHFIFLRKTFDSRDLPIWTTWWAKSEIWKSEILKYENLRFRKCWKSIFQNRKKSMIKITHWMVMTWANLAASY